MLISVFCSKLFQKYGGDETQMQSQQQASNDGNNSYHGHRSIHRHRSRRHSTTKMNIQEEYERIEASLCNMYVVEHHSKYCHHQHDHDNNDKQHVIVCKNENDDNDVSDHHRPYDIESQHGEQLICDTKGSFRNSIHKKSHHNNVLNMSSVHSITTSCSSRSTCNDDENNITINRHNHNNECPICLNHFHIGQIVSMSPKDTSKASCSCQHIFHHVCIKEWLLKHNTCPSCRQVYFQDHDDDENMNSNNNNNIVINEAQHNQNMMMVESSEPIIMKNQNGKNKNDNKTKKMIMFYCIRHGIGYYNVASSSLPRSNSSRMIMNRSFHFLSSSLSSFGSIHNNKNKDLKKVPKISVPTSSELAHMRIQQHDEQPTIIVSSLSLQQQQIDHDDDILRNHDDTIINNHQDISTPNGTTSITDRDYNNNNYNHNNDDHDDDTITAIIINNTEQNNDSRMIITTTAEETITSTTIISPSSQEQPSQEQIIQEDDVDQVNDDVIVVNQYHIQYSL